MRPLLGSDLRTAVFVFLRKRHAGGGEGRLLTLGHLGEREAFDFLIEDLVEVQFGGEVQEDRTEADSRAVHEDEFARHRHRSHFLQRLVDAKDPAYRD